MQLENLRVFVCVAERESFTKASEKLGLSKGRASAVIKQLETQLGVSLLQRTTRTVQLTFEGELLLDRARDLLIDAELVQTLFQPKIGNLCGRVRIDLPSLLARELVIPKLPAFLATHPMLDLSITTSERLIDFQQENADCAVRIGNIGDTELIVRPLSGLPMRNLASPTYLSAYGTPRSLSDLVHHCIVQYCATSKSQSGYWRYRQEGELRKYPVRSALKVNSADAYIAACVAGIGLIQAPISTTQRWVDAGLLVDVLPELCAAPLPVSLLYPNQRNIAPRVQTVQAWLTKVLTHNA